MPLLTRQDPLLALFKFYDLVGIALTKMKKIMGEILKVLFNLIFVLPLCTYHCLTPIFHSSFSSLSTYFSLSLSCVCRYVYKAGLLFFM